MPQIDVALQLLAPDVPVPHYAQPGDAGADLVTVEDVRLGPGERYLASTGIAIALPEGFVGLVHPRSGLAAKKGLSIVNSAWHHRCGISWRAQSGPDQYRSSHRDCAQPGGSYCAIGHSARLSGLFPSGRQVAGIGSWPAGFWFYRWVFAHRELERTPVVL